MFWEPPRMRFTLLYYPEALPWSAQYSELVNDTADMLQIRYYVGRNVIQPRWNFNEAFIVVSIPSPIVSLAHHITLFRY